MQAAKNAKYAWPVFLTAGLVITLAILIAVYLMTLHPMIKDHWNRTSFDSIAWKNPNLVYSDNPVRIRMVDDLIGKTDLHFKTRDEIEVLLGPSTETVFFRQWDLVYWLGPERGFISLDSEWLILRLDDNGRVSEYHIVTD